jgi:hypothetical protein
MAARKKIGVKKKTPAGPAPARKLGSVPNPLEERARYPHEGRTDPPEPAPTGAPNPERVDPSPRTPVEEPEATELGGQEGVGPGPRDAIRRREQGLPDPEEES